MLRFIIHKQLFKDLQLYIFTRPFQNALQSDLLKEEIRDLWST